MVCLGCRFCKVEINLCQAVEFPGEHLAVLVAGAAVDVGSHNLALEVAGACVLAVRRCEVDGVLASYESFDGLLLGVPEELVAVAESGCMQARVAVCIGVLRVVEGVVGVIVRLQVLFIKVGAFEVEHGLAVDGFKSIDKLLCGACLAVRGVAHAGADVADVPYPVAVVGTVLEDGFFVAGAA